VTPEIQMDNADTVREIFSARESPDTPQSLSDSYRLAFADPDFLERSEVRGIRFQLELMKADLVLRENKIDHTIVVFGSARFVSQDDAQKLVAQADSEEAQLKANRAVTNSTYYESARAFGLLVARHNLMQSDLKKRLYICTGGGPGVMEGANRGAFEAGDLSIGLNISLPHEQTPNAYITPALCFRFHYFALRKMHFLLRARAIVVYPGGFGSFDEAFETLTLIQTKKIKPMPIILVGSSHWQTVVRFDLLVEHGLINAQDLKIISFVDDADQAWNVIKHWYELN